MNEQRNTKHAALQQGLDSQSVGLLPVLLLMLLSSFYPYRISFIVAVVCCAGSVLLFGSLFKDRVYVFMLLPVSLTLVFYSLFISSSLEPSLYNYTPLITEWLLVALLSLTGSFRRPIFKYVRKSKRPVLKYAQFRTALMEYFYVAQIVQNLYTLHFFILLFYVIFEINLNVKVDRFLYHEAPFIIGMLVVIYEQVRLFIVKRRLRQEIWLPVLDVNGKVIGRIAYSVSLNSSAKYRHPVVRVAVVCRGMLYLTRNAAGSPVSPGTLDYPFLGYVMFKRTLEQTLKELIGRYMPGDLLNPRFLIRYLFENKNVCSLVSLYVATLKSEEDFKKYIRHTDGKLWTKKQIEANLHKGVFSEYFEKEYACLQHTVLLSEELYPE
jgi:hypothetical protein